MPMRIGMVAVGSGFINEVKVRNVSESSTEGGWVNRENIIEENTNTGSCVSTGTAIINAGDTPCFDSSFFRSPFA
jgi:hypothetical protein